RAACRSPARPEKRTSPEPAPLTLNREAVPPRITTSPDPADAIDTGPLTAVTMTSPDPAASRSSSPVAPAQTEPEPAESMSSLCDVPARTSPDPAWSMSSRPLTLATTQSPQPALPTETELAPRPTAP